MEEWMQWLLAGATLTLVTAAFITALYRPPRLAPPMPSTTEENPRPEKKTVWRTLVHQFQHNTPNDIQRFITRLAAHLPRIPDDVLKELIAVSIRRDMISTLQLLVEKNKLKIPGLFPVATWGADLAAFKGSATRRNEMAHLFLDALVDPDDLKKHGFVMTCFSSCHDTVHVWGIDLHEINTVAKDSASFLATDRVEYTIGFQASISRKRAQKPSLKEHPARLWGYEEAQLRRPQKFTV